MARYDRGRWSLKDLIEAPSGPAMDAVLAELEEAVVRMEAHREVLAADLAESAFAGILEDVERVSYTARKLGAYATLWFSEQTSDQDALAFSSRMDKILAETENRILFFDLWWKGLDEANAQRLMAASGDIRQHLISLRAMAPFTLSESVEQVINIKNVNGVRGLSTLYDMITNDFIYDVEIDGEIKALTRTELMVYARDPLPERRAAAYQALYDVFAEHGGVLGQIYAYVAGDWHAERIGLRGMASPIAARNLANDIPDDVVDVLLGSCRKNVPVFQRFFRMKAKWIGMETLRRYDIYAPIEAPAETVPFSEGAKMVLETMAAFSPEMAALAERVLAEGHLDAEVRAGKDTGAFCFGVVSDKTPWVSVNYNELLNDVSTLGHELGHAVHSMLAAGHSPLTFHSALPMAETASNFVEILLLKRMLAEAEDPSLRRHLLAKFVDDAYGSILRQAFFVLFERDAHDLINGPGATVDQLAERYLENLREQFGDSVEISDEFRWEWTSIPHIYQVPFYCYAYAFGLLLVLALYREYERMSEDFVPKYLKILAYGGSLSAIEILDEVGIDIRTDAFWQGGFDVIADMISELEALS